MGIKKRLLRRAGRVAGRVLVSGMRKGLKKGLRKRMHVRLRNRARPMLKRSLMKGARRGGRLALRAGKQLLARRQRPKGELTLIVKSKILGKAPEEYHFTLRDGQKLKSVYDLIEKLETMDDSLFRSHVGLLKNDFSNWLRTAFNEQKLASDIRHVYDRFEAQRVLMRRIVEEVKKIAKK